jgi:ketosteroid isomerase-like protein
MSGNLQHIIMLLKPYKTPRLLITIVLITTMLFNCNNTEKQNMTNETASISLEAEKTAIKNTLINMWAAIENEDIDAYASYVHPDFSQFGEYDSIIKLGKPLEVKGVSNWVKDSDNIHTEMIDPIVTIKGNVAWITYYWSDHGTTNGEPFASRGKSTRIFVKEGENWLCIHGHYTLLPPPN